MSVCVSGTLTVSSSSVEFSRWILLQHLIGPLQCSSERGLEVSFFEIYLVKPLFLDLRLSSFVLTLSSQQNLFSCVCTVGEGMQFRRIRAIVYLLFPPPYNNNNSININKAFDAGTRCNGLSSVRDVRECHDFS